MKKIVLILLFCQTTLFAQGNLSGEFKNLIGLSYSQEKGIDGLKAFRNEQGIVLGEPVNGTFFSILEVYRKGNSFVVVLSKKTNKNSDSYRIIDIVKINSVPKNYEVRISDCSRKNGYVDEKIVAVVFSGVKRQVKIIKEAFVLKDIRFEKITPKGIRCINEGID